MFFFQHNINTNKIENNIDETHKRWGLLSFKHNLIKFWKNNRLEK